MKIGDKMVCVDNSLLIKGETYYFDHIDLWNNYYVYVKDNNNMIYWTPIEHFMTLIQERKVKLDRINESR